LQAIFQLIALATGASCCNNCFYLWTISVKVL
jgi:hypothetical protein